MIERKATLLFEYAFALLLFSLPFSLAIPNIILLPLAVALILKKQRIKQNKAVLSASALVVFLFVKAALLGSLSDNISVYKLLGLLVIVGVLVSAVSNRKIVVAGFILGVCAAVILSGWNIFSHYMATNSIPLGNSAEVSELLLIHRPYFGFVCFLAVVFLFDLQKSASKKYKTAIVLLAGFLTLFTFFIVARLSMMLLVIFLLVQAFLLFRNSNLKTRLLTAASIVIFGWVLVTNANIKERFHINKSLDKTMTVAVNQEPRVVIWKCFFNYVNSGNTNHLMGIGNAKIIQKQLNTCFANSISNTSKKEYYLQVQFNTHNQFFDLYLQGGIIAVLFFVGMFYFRIKCSALNTTNVFLIFGFLAFAAIENIFHRQLGVYLFGVFMFLNTNNLFQRKL